MVDYKKVFDAVKDGKEDELKQMIDEGTKRYAEIGIDIAEESGYQEFVANMLEVPHERAVEIYETVQFIVNSKHSDFQDFKDFAKLAQEKVDKLTPREAMLAGLIASMQMRTQVRMMLKAKAEAEGKQQTQPPVAERKQTIMNEPLCDKKEAVQLDEDGEVEEKEPVYQADYSYTVGYQ